VIPGGNLDSVDATRALDNAPPGNLLEPFRLALGARLEDVARALPASTRRSLVADETRYVELLLVEAGLPTQGPAGLPSPDGTRVVDGNLYFDASGSLIEASLVLERTLKAERVVLDMTQWLGRPDFEVVLPGGLDMLVGWRSDEGYLIGSFSDIDLFQISAFRYQPDDLLTGSHLLRELLEIVSWVEQARKMIAPGP
jgi:hypothetical protein